MISSFSFERNLDKYAEVIVKVGLNLQPGQRLLIGMPFYDFIGTPIELAPLVRYLVTHAYQVGAKYVDVLWNDEQIELVRYQNAPRDSFGNFPYWRTNAALDIAEAGDAILILIGGMTDLLSQQNPDHINTFFQTTLNHMKPVIDLRVKNAINFAIAFAPVEGWANKVFHEFRPACRIAQAWDTIFDICRVNNPDPVLAWKKHILELKQRSEYMNEKQYFALHFIGPGTDLTVGLPEMHIWCSGGMSSQNGIDFVGNIPTEEIFTMPHKEKTEGVVRTTKTTPHPNQDIEEIELKFSRGKVVKATAGQGQEYLQQILETDQGMLRLGEVALVPHSSPISQTKLLYYSVIIDENASNHIALGRAYQFCIEGGPDMAEKEFSAAGGNLSLHHQDLMIGTGDMDVFGIKANGSPEIIMKSGEWAFET